MTINLKKNKGITTVDTAIALVIAVIFATAMTSLFYNVYLATTEAKRTAVGLNYAVDIFENIAIKDFSSVTPTSALSSIPEIENVTGSSTATGTAKGKIGTYDITLDIKNYKDTTKMKIITLEIEYPVSRKNTEKIELQRVKVMKKEEI